ncbi:MAG: hypothetical protein P9L94_16500 [Candidatus Hinthialibacter antarcticus]|nr:hypothetical protein [Candidatus Hinthialibacter antarcticus]
MKFIIRLFIFALLIISPFRSNADLLFDGFDNDGAATNGVGTDGAWNLPPDSDYQVAFEAQKVHQGSGALKVSWDGKDLWSSFVFSDLDKAGNVGSLFQDADAVRMAIAGPAGRIIIKLIDSEGFATGDVASLDASGSDEYEIVEFPITSAFNFPIDPSGIKEFVILPDAGQQGTAADIYIDSIELIQGSGDGATVIGVVDNFDNDNSIQDDPNTADSTPSAFSLLPGPFVTSVVDDPSGADNKVLRVDYNTSPWNVLWVTDLDVTDWSEVETISIDVYGSANGILLKYKDASGAEQEPGGGLQDHVGDQWDTLTWDSFTVSSIDIFNMDKLIVFIEGPNGGEGTIYLDNLTLTGPLTAIQQWSLY